MKKCFRLKKQRGSICLQVLKNPPPAVTNNLCCYLRGHFASQAAPDPIKDRRQSSALVSNKAIFIALAMLLMSNTFAGEYERRRGENLSARRPARNLSVSSILIQPHQTSS